jgi:hypothetical protein
MDYIYDFRRIFGWIMSHSEISILLYSIVRYKSDTIAKVMVTSPPDVTFRRDLLGPRLTDWNALLPVQLSSGSDEFC